MDVTDERYFAKFEVKIIFSLRGGEGGVGHPASQHRPFHYMKHRASDAHYNNMD